MVRNAAPASSEKKKKPTGHPSKAAKRKNLTYEHFQHEPACIRYGCTPNKLFSLANACPAGSEKRRLIEELGFGGLLSLKLKFVNRKLLKELLFDFDEDSRTLHICEREITISPSMVEDIFGLNSTGINVECYDIGEEIEDHLNFFLKEGGLKTANLSELILKKDAEESPQLFKAAAMLYLVSIFISPTADPEVPRNYLSVARNVDNIPKMNWAKHLLDRLCEGISRWRKGQQLYVSGCVMLLEVRICSR